MATSKGVKNTGGGGGSWGGSVQGASTSAVPQWLQQLNSLILQQSNQLQQYKPTPTFSQPSAAPQNSNNVASDAINNVIDNAYNSTINDLNSQESNIRNQQSSIEGDINSQYDTSVKNLGTNLNQSQSQIDMSAQQGGQRQQDALIAARRLYNELAQGGQQRFGGSTSAGEAYQALTGRELQRNNQQITTDYNSFMGQIAQAKASVQSKYDEAIANLQTQKTLALNQAQRDFQDRLTQINSMKNQAAGNKYSMQLSALQELRNQIYNINLATASSNTNINQFKTKAESELTNAINSFGYNNSSVGSNLNAFNSEAPTNPTSTFAMSTPGQNQAYSPTGQTTNNFIGQIAGQPINPNDLFKNQRLFA